jgi:hypothetical protein
MNPNPYQSPSEEPGSAEIIESADHDDDTVAYVIAIVSFAACIVWSSVVIVAVGR